MLSPLPKSARAIRCAPHLLFDLREQTRVHGLELRLFLRTPFLFVLLIVERRGHDVGNELSSESMNIDRSVA